MVIQWLGHSCFKLTYRDYSIVLDPYKPSSNLHLNEIHPVAHQVLCSHEHFDHNYREAVTIIDTNLQNPFVINRLMSFHDDESGIKRGVNYLTIIQVDDIKVAHLGDLGCMPDDSQIKELMNMDALMIPVGGYYTIDALQAKKLCDQIKPRVIIPMHFKTMNQGHSVLASVDDFLNLFESKMIKRINSNGIEIDYHNEPMVILFETNKV